MIFIYLIALAIVFYPALNHLVSYGWEAADYTHAYFVLPISLVIIWFKRHALTLRTTVSFPGFIFLFISLWIYAFAVVNGFMFLEAFGVCFVIWSIASIKLTPASCRVLIFPLTYLLFIVPPPSIVIDSITFPLKKISTWGSAVLLKLFQFPLEVHGAVLKVGDHHLLVSDACSGFRSVVTMLCLGAVYIYLQKLPTTTKWILFSLIVPLSVIANILRISLTAFLAYRFNPKLAEGFFHSFSGIVLFMIVAGVLIGLTEIAYRRNSRE